MGTIFRAIPFTILPAILYALFALPMGYQNMRAALDAPIFSMVLPSGSDWVVGRGDALLMFAAGCLFVEIVKATSTARAALVENTLAVLCFTVCFVAFLLVPAFGTNEFFLITSILLVDFIASFIVMTVSARRDVTFNA